MRKHICSALKYQHDRVVNVPHCVCARTRVHECVHVCANVCASKAYVKL